MEMSDLSLGGDRRRQRRPRLPEVPSISREDDEWTHHQLRPHAPPRAVSLGFTLLSFSGVSSPPPRFKPSSSLSRAFSPSTRFHASSSHSRDFSPRSPFQQSSSLSLALSPPPSFQGSSYGSLSFLPPPSFQPSSTPSRLYRYSTALKSESIIPPFPWATNRRAGICSRELLLSMGLQLISGDVQCRNCNIKASMEFDLVQSFKDFSIFILSNKARMEGLAPDCWLHPKLPRCPSCQKDNTIFPVISTRKRSINWLFMWLGQMLGCCTMDQLKYFCKHNKKSRIGRKAQLLYVTYLTICKQLEPRGPFDP